MERQTRDITGESVMKAPSASLQSSFASSVGLAKRTKRASWRASCAAPAQETVCWRLPATRTDRSDLTA